MESTRSRWLACGVLAGIACGAMPSSSQGARAPLRSSPPVVRYAVFSERDRRIVGLAIRERSEVKLARPSTGRPLGRTVTLFRSESVHGVCAVSPSGTGRQVLICGNHEAAIDEDGGWLWLKSADGRLKRKLRVPDPEFTTAYVNLQWSSDDSTVSYITDEPQGGPEGTRWDVNLDPNSNRLYVQRVQAGSPRLVARRAFASAWVPGSDLLAYTLQRQRGLFVASGDGRRSVRVLDAPAESALAISGDGRVAALASGKSLTLARLPKDRARVRTRWETWKTLRVGLDVSQMSLSPNGKTLGLLLRIPNPRGGLVGALVALDLASQAVRGLGVVHDARDISLPYDSLPPGFIRSSIFISEVTGRSLRWSPDGRWLMMGQDSHSYIAVRADGGKPVPLDRAGLSNLAPAKSVTLYHTPSQLGQVEWVEVK